MNDVYSVKSTTWGGCRRVRDVYAADEDDARETHELHYPGELIVNVRPR